MAKPLYCPNSFQSQVGEHNSGNVGTKGHRKQLQMGEMTRHGGTAARSLHSIVHSSLPFSVTVWEFQENALNAFPAFLLGE